MFLGSEGIRPAPPPVAFGGGETGPGREREAGCRAVAGPASRRPPGPGPSRAGSVGGLAPLAGGVGRGRPGGGSASGRRRRRPLASLPRAPPRPSPPPTVQVPSASRRGGLKTLWGSPVRLGSGRSGPRGGSVPSPRLRRLGPRHPVGCAGGVATPRARSTRPPGGGSPPARWPLCRVRVRVRPPPASPVWRGAGQVGTPWAPVGLSSLAPRACAGAAAGRPASFVRPFRPSRSV